MTEINISFPLINWCPFKSLKQLQTCKIYRRLFLNLFMLGGFENTQDFKVRNLKLSPYCFKRQNLQHICISVQRLRIGFGIWYYKNIFMLVLLSVRKPLVSEWNVGLRPVPVSHASHTIQLYQVAIELPIAFPHGQCLFTITINGLWIVDVSNTGYHILCEILCCDAVLEKCYFVLVYRTKYLFVCLSNFCCSFFSLYCMVPQGFGGS